MKTIDEKIRKKAKIGLYLSLPFAVLIGFFLFKMEWTVYTQLLFIFIVIYMENVLAVLIHVAFY